MGSRNATPPEEVAMEKYEAEERALEELIDAVSEGVWPHAPDEATACRLVASSLLDVFGNRQRAYRNWH